MLKMKLGADPEFFVRNRKTKHKISAHDLVPGTKQEPYKLPNGGSVQADGTAIEFNTVPAESAKEFADNVLSALNDVRKMVDNRFEFVFLPTVKYAPLYYSKIPDNAKELGCDPDYNAYTGAPNPRPIPPIETLRTGAGHLHVGWTDGIENPLNPGHMKDCMLLVKTMGEYHYYESKFWAQPGEALRRRMYGARGAFRPKPYGVEYRSLSNSWLGCGRPVYEYLFNLTEYTFKRCVDPRVPHQYVPLPIIEPKVYM